MVSEDYAVIREYQTEIMRITESRDYWKRLFIQMYEQKAGITDEMMWAYRNETGKA